MSNINSGQARMSLAEMGEKMKGMATWFWVTAFLSFLIFPPIVFLIKYFGYISKLGKVKDATGDPDLERSYKMELGSLLLQIFGPIIAIAVIFSMLSGFSIDLFLSGAGFTYIVILLVLAVSLPFILKIMALSSLRDWASNTLGRGGNYDYASQEIIKGTKSMKTGAILSVIPLLNIIGTIIYYVKMKKVGKALINKFG